MRHFLKIFRLHSLSHRARIAVLAPATAFLAAFTFAGYLSPIVAVVIAMLLIVIGMAFLRVKTDPLPEPAVQEGMPAAVLEGISDAVL